MKVQRKKTDDSAVSTEKKGLNKSDMQYHLELLNNVKSFGEQFVEHLETTIKLFKKQSNL